MGNLGMPLEGAESWKTDSRSGARLQAEVASFSFSNFALVPVLVS